MVKRVRRVVLGLIVGTASVVLVLGLSYLGSSSEGPITDTLAWIGVRWAQAEQGVARWLQGTDRAAELPWMEHYRADPAALRAPTSTLLGAYDEAIPGSLEGALALERELGSPLSVLQVYSAWGDRPDQQFPVRALTAISDLGSVPLVTWEPWLVDFENSAHPHLDLRDERDDKGLADVAAGVYDFYVDEWARQAARFERPLLVRFAHEMNDPYRYPWGPHNNTADEFVLAWRHVVERFRAAGADNVVWVWSPHVAYEGFEWFYPGDAFVDWVATGALNYGTVATWSQWWTFRETFGTHYEALAAWGKPIMIAELGSLAVGGDRAAWYRDALTSIPVDYPAVKAVLFFHVASDATITYQALDWSIVGDSVLVSSIQQALAAWPPPNSEPPEPGSP